VEVSCQPDAPPTLPTGERAPGTQLAGHDVLKKRITSFPAGNRTPDHTGGLQITECTNRTHHLNVERASSLIKIYGFWGD
jgi:hypothetical protein